MRVLSHIPELCTNKQLYLPLPLHLSIPSSHFTNLSQSSPISSASLSHLITIPDCIGSYNTLRESTSYPYSDSDENTNTTTHSMLSYIASMGFRAGSPPPTTTNATSASVTTANQPPSSPPTSTISAPPPPSDAVSATPPPSRPHTSASTSCTPSSNANGAFERQAGAHRDSERNDNSHSDKGAGMVAAAGADTEDRGQTQSQAQAQAAESTDPAAVTHTSKGNEQAQGQSQSRAVRFSDSQRSVLKASFKVNNRPSKEEKSRLVKLTGLSEKEISVWFYNQRNTIQRNIKIKQGESVTALQSLQLQSKQHFNEAIVVNTMREVGKVEVQETSNINTSNVSMDNSGIPYTGEPVSNNISMETEYEDFQGATHSVNSSRSSDINVNGESVMSGAGVGGSDAAYIDECARLRAEVEHYKKQYAKERKVNQSLVNAETLTNSVLAIREEERWQEIAQRGQAKIKQLQEYIERIEKGGEEMRRQRDEASKELTESKESQSKLSEQISRLTNQVQDHSNSIAKLESENVKLTDRLDEVRGREVSLKDEKLELKNQLDSLKSQVDGLVGENVRLKKEVVDEKSASSKLANDVKVLGDERDKAMRGMGQLRVESGNLNQRLDAATRTIQESGNKIGGLEQDVARLSTLLDDVRGKKVELEGLLKSSNQVESVMRERMREMKMKYRELQSLVGRVLVYIDSLQQSAPFAIRGVTVKHLVHPVIETSVITAVLDVLKMNQELREAIVRRMEKDQDHEDKENGEQREHEREMRNSSGNASHTASNGAVEREDGRVAAVQAHDGSGDNTVFPNSATSSGSSSSATSSSSVGGVTGYGGGEGMDLDGDKSAGEDRPHPDHHEKHKASTTPSPSAPGASNTPHSHTKRTRPQSSGTIHKNQKDLSKVWEKSRKKAKRQSPTNNSTTSSSLSSTTTTATQDEEMKDMGTESRLSDGQDNMKCKYCKLARQVSEFYPGRGGNEKVRSYCKPCGVLYAQQNGDQAERDKVRAGRHPQQIQWRREDENQQHPASTLSRLSTSSDTSASSSSSSSSTTATAAATAPRVQEDRVIGADSTKVDEGEGAGLEDEFRLVVDRIRTMQKVFGIKSENLYHDIDVDCDKLFKEPPCISNIRHMMNYRAVSPEVKRSLKRWMKRYDEKTANRIIELYGNERVVEADIYISREEWNSYLDMALPIEQRIRIDPFVYKALKTPHNLTDEGNWKLFDRVPR